MEGNNVYVTVDTKPYKDRNIYIAIIFINNEMNCYKSSYLNIIASYIKNITYDKNLYIDGYGSGLALREALDIIGCKYSVLKLSNTNLDDYIK